MTDKEIVLEKYPDAVCIGFRSIKAYSVYTVHPSEWRNSENPLVIGNGVNENEAWNHAKEYLVNS